MLHERSEGKDGMLKQIDKREALKHAAFIVCVGAASALTSIILYSCIVLTFHLYQKYTWLLFLLPLFGIVSLAVYRSFNLPYDYSTEDMVGQMRKNESVSPTLAPGILIGTCLSILGGATVGKESGALQMGASVSETIGRRFRLKNCLKSKQDGILNGYAAQLGMSATFSALFCAPLCAVFMSLELTHFKNFSIPRFAALIASSTLAAVIAKATGIYNIIPKVHIPDFSASLALNILLVGIVCGVLGCFHGRAMGVVRRWRQRHIRNPYIAVAIAGVVIVALISFLKLYAYSGSGAILLSDALAGKAGTFDFAIKAGFMLLALPFGFKGGEILPTLAIGGLLGCSLGQILGVEPAFTAAIGIVTFYVGFSRCPLAGFFLGTEVFGWAIAPFMAIGVIVALLGAEDVGFYGDGVTKLFRKKREELSCRIAQRSHCS